MTRGAVPYRDLFSHKGPFWYALYAVGTLVDSSGFTGIFLLQIISMFFTLLFAYKTANLFIENNNVSLFMAFLVPIALFSQGIYVHETNYGGGCPEDLLLPMIAASIYFLLAYYKNDDGHYRQSVYLPMFLCGLFCSVLFFSKFTLMAFIIGLILPIIIDMLCKKKWITLSLAVLFFLLGFMVIAVPYLIYALATNSFADFWEAYITFNIAYGGGDYGFFSSIAKGFSHFISNLLEYQFVCGVVLVGMGYLLGFARRIRIPIRVGVVLSLFSLGTITFNTAFAYTLIPITYYCLFGYIGLYKIINGWLTKRKELPVGEKKLAFCIASLLVLAVTIGSNRLIVSDLSIIYNNVNITPFQQNIARIVLADQTQNQSLLQLGRLDLGIYNATGMIPKSKYFITPNISYVDYPAIFEGQLQDVQTGLNTYVVTPSDARYIEWFDDRPLNEETQAGKMDNAIISQYSLIGIFPGTYLQSGETFYLYKLKDRVLNEKGQQLLFTAQNEMMVFPESVIEKDNTVISWDNGVAFFGPYIDVPKGIYDVTFRFSECDLTDDASAYVDIHHGTTTEKKYLNTGETEVTLRKVFKEDASGVEFRCFLNDFTGRIVLKEIQITRVGDV